MVVKIFDPLRGGCSDRSKLGPADLPRMLEKIDEGFDVVSGWRKDRQDNALQRNIPSIMANKLISVVSGVPLH
ncbi:MAG: glycosyltransferase, partial [Chthoniobacterales bacterium]